MDSKKKKETVNSQGLGMGKIIAIILGVEIVLLALFMPFLPKVVKNLGLNNYFYQPDYNIDWVKSVEMQLRKSYYAGAEFPLEGEMRLMWQTPIMVINVAALIGSIDVPNFNSKLVAAVMKEYDNLKEENEDIFSMDGSSVTDLNQVFFEWQSKGGFKNLESTFEVQLLQEFANSAVDRYFETLGKKEIIEKRSRELDMWATVHKDCVHHMRHLHPNSLISGVFYVKMPVDAGTIVFEDPRGPLPPFDGKLQMKPLIGDLVLFPSWLMHSVSPTKGDDVRISFAFNIPGEWIDTAQISEWFPVK